ncbi:MAG: hypothetical protein COA84_10925 [Robiginitomaculum sp.]|nr:MAG: hypothetical protein COA84_10925 [Robiginitomaculum sp.]
MTDSTELQKRHENTLERIERSAELIRQRQTESHQIRERQSAQITMIEGANAKELLELQHELNKENRLFDHQFALAEDARELEREACEILLRRRDDFIRHHWEKDKEILALELRVIEKMIEGRSKERFSKQEHKQAKDFANHNTKLEKELFAYKEKFAAELKVRTNQMEAAEVSDHLDKMFKDGKLD